ncbi:MAG: hypothetical protein HWN66_08635 [Candidatus Helarchaeota archaeon]|nr:hypothetical protein [Candidatus Helarchaeota archaeon]
MGKKKKKIDLGPFSEDEVEEVREKPKKKKWGGLPDEPWLKKEKYYQDSTDAKDKKDKERERKGMYDDYYDDYYDGYMDDD